MPPRKRTEKPVEAAPEQPAEVPAPLAPVVEPPAELAAPLTPPSEDPPPTADPASEPEPAEPAQDGLHTPAAPLTPPAAPLAPPPPPVVPEPSIREMAAPGAEFIDLLDEASAPIDPDAMFVEVSNTATYVLTAQRIRRLYRETGATQLGVQLLYPARRKVDKGEAAKLRAELVAVRAAQAVAVEAAAQE
uniref:hypothetical protein n=1 Tax=Streptosporangium sp. CA-235898 TaxID=3240073 RepID=UPI003F49656D